MAKNKGKVVACLDIGTTKLVCLIATIIGQEIKILGYGYRKSKGIVASAISDMKLAQKSITDVVCDAEKMAGFNIDRLVIGLSGTQTLSQKKVIKSKITSDMVKNSDITNLANNIRLQYKKNNREVIHLIPLQYCIDDSNPVKNPRYMTGKFLSAKFHIISTSSTTTKNIENCLRRCQLSVYNYIAESYSSALSSLTDNELSLGTAIIDIGGGDTSFAIVTNNNLVYTSNFPIGGTHITRDIAIILNVDFDTAETIKNLNNSLSLNPVEKKETINFQTNDADILNFSKITKNDLKKIVESRLEEIFETIKNKMENAGYGTFAINSLVLTGGVANTIGIENVVNRIFKKPIRIARPNRIANLPESFYDPSFCSVFGMLNFLKNIYLKENIRDGFETRNGFLKKIIDKLMSI